MKNVIGVALTVMMLAGVLTVNAAPNRPRLDDRPTLRELKRMNDEWYRSHGRLRSHRGYNATRSRLDDRPTLRDLKQFNEGNLQSTGRIRSSESYFEDASRLDQRPLSSSVQNLGDRPAYQDPGYWQGWWGETALPDPATTMPPLLNAPLSSVCVACGDRPIQTTVDAVMWNNATYVAAVDYFAALGARMYYDDAHKSALAYMPDKTWIVLPLGQNLIYVDREPRTLAQPTAVANGILMVPVRTLSEQLGLAVRWDAATSTAILTLPAENPSDDEVAVPRPYGTDESMTTPQTP